MTLYFGLSRMWLSKCTWTYKNIIQLNILSTFLYKIISEASKCHMCKFYRIASNSLQARQIVHERFDCPSYMWFFYQHRGVTLPAQGLQLTSLSKGQHTYLVSSLQMTLRKACSDTKMFPRLPRGSNPTIEQLRPVCALTTRLPCFSCLF